MELSLPPLTQESQLIISARAKQEFDALLRNYDLFSRRITLVRGPSGCGKDTMIRYFAAKYGYTIIMDREIEEDLATGNLVGQTDKDDELEYFGEEDFANLPKKGLASVTNCKIFTETVDRACFQVHSANRYIYYLRDIPNLKNLYEKQAVTQALSKLEATACSFRSVPMVFCLNSSVYDEYHFMQLWPASLHSKVFSLPGVYSNNVSIEKAITGIVNTNTRLKITPGRLEAITKIADGDMNVALNLLRILPGKANPLQQDWIDKELYDTNIFKRLAKVLYNKRKPLPGIVFDGPGIKVQPDGTVTSLIISGKQPKSFRFEGVDFELHRNNYYFDPLQLVRSQNCLNRHTQKDFRGLIFENYLDFCGDIEDVDYIIGEIVRLETYEKALFLERVGFLSLTSRMRI